MREDPDGRSLDFRSTNHLFLKKRKEKPLLCRAREIRLDLGSESCRVGAGLLGRQEVQV